MNSHGKTREQLADELRQSERRFRSFTEGAPDYIVQVDRDGKILFVNRTYAGLSEDSLVGSCILDWLPPEFRASFGSTLAGVFASGENEITEYRARDSRGRDLWYSAHIGAARGEGPADTAILVIRDITKRKRAEDTLHIQRDLAVALAAGPTLDEGLRLCIEAALRVSGMDSGGIYLFDGASGELRLAFHKGLSESFVSRSSAYDADSPNVILLRAGGPTYARTQLLPGPFREQLLAEGLRALGVIPLRCDHQVIGCMIVASHTVDAVPDSCRPPLETIAAQIGATIGRLKADEARRETAERFRKLLDSSFDGVAVSENGKIVETNGAMTAALGYEPHQMIGRALTDFVTPEFRELVSENIAKGYDKPYQARGMRKDGSIFDVEACGVAASYEGRPARIAALRDISARRQSEEEIRQARDRYLAITNLTGDIIVHLDGEGKWVFLNDGACAFWGEPREALLGKAFTDYVHPDDLERTLAVIQQNKNTDELRGFVNRQKTPGGWRTVEWNGAWFRNQDGESQGFQATGRDVTDREQMEKALRESENRFRELFDRMSSGVVVYEALDGGDDFVVVDFNRGAQEIERVSKESVIGKRLTTVFPMAREGGFLDVLRRVWRTGEPENHPVTRYGGPGRVRWRRYSTYRLASGEMVAVYDDVTEQKRAEEALKESEEKYRSLVETAHDMIVSWDQNGTITYVNEQEAGVLGYEEEERVGRAVIDFLPPEDADKIRDVIKAIHGGEERVSYEQRVLAKDGRVLLMDFNATPLRDGNGEVIGTVATGRDITDRNRMEEEAERHRHDLARTDKLTSLGTLVSGVAHEINNPNHFIMLNAPILRDTWKDLQPVLEDVAQKDPDFRLANLSFDQMREEVPRLIDDIIEGSDRIKHITSELRDYSREQSPDTMRPVAVNDVVRSALTLLGTPIRKATSRFSVDYGDDLPRIRGNHRRLEQVIINLILNACQSLADRTKAVGVTTRHHPKAGRVVVSVQDEGCGIPEVNLERIRHPFYTTRPDQGGTGLGLAVAAKIVYEHKGHLVFESTVGEGTTARVLLPVIVE